MNETDDPSARFRSPGIVYADTVSVAFDEFDSDPDPHGRVWDESKNLTPIAHALAEQVRQFFLALTAWPEYPTAVADSPVDVRLEFVLQRADELDWQWWGSENPAFEDVDPQDLFRYVLGLVGYSGRYSGAWEAWGLQLFVGESLAPLGSFAGDDGEGHAPSTLEELLWLVGDLTVELGHIVAHIGTGRPSR